MTVAHVGDSRCYLVRDGELQRLTDDHSLVGDLVRLGKLTEEQAESHPQRSVITRALGPEPNVQVDVEDFPAQAGDLFLVCSDGLTSMVREAKLKPLLLEHDGPLDQLGRDLIAAANAAGGRDNITVILFTLEEVDGPGASPSHAGAAAAAARRGHARVRHLPGRGRGRAAPGREPPAGPHPPLRRGARVASGFAGRRPTAPRPSTAPRAPSRCPRSARARSRSRRATRTARPRRAPRRRRRRLFSPGQAARPRLRHRPRWPPSGSRRARSSSSASTNPAATSSPSTRAFRTTSRSGSGSTRRSATPA